MGCTYNVTTIETAPPADASADVIEMADAAHVDAQLLEPLDASAPEVQPEADPPPPPPCDYPHWMYNGECVTGCNYVLKFAECAQLGKSTSIECDNFDGGENLVPNWGSPGDEPSARTDGCILDHAYDYSYEWCCP